MCWRNGPRKERVLQALGSQKNNNRKETPETYEINGCSGTRGAWRRSREELRDDPQKLDRARRDEGSRLQGFTDDTTELAKREDEQFLCAWDCMGGYDTDSCTSRDGFVTLAKPPPGEGKEKSSSPGTSPVQISQLFLQSANCFVVFRSPYACIASCLFLGSQAVWRLGEFVQIATYLRRVYVYVPSGRNLEAKKRCASADEGAVDISFFRGKTWLRSAGVWRLCARLSLCQVSNVGEKTVRAGETEVGK